MPQNQRSYSDKEQLEYIGACASSFWRQTRFAVLFLIALYVLYQLIY